MASGMPELSVRGKIRRVKTKRGGSVDPRAAFISSASTLLVAFSQLASFRIVGNTAVVATGLANTVERKKCEEVDLQCVRLLHKVTAQDHAIFNLLFRESTVVLAYSWLEAFLSEVEEMLFLSTPSNLGESVQVKLGKVLEMSSIEELIHDLTRRRVRERSQWGLANRIKDLQDSYGFTTSLQLDEIRSFAELRIEIIHNRRPGTFELKGKKIRYQPRADKKALEDEETIRALSDIFVLMADLYESSSRYLKLKPRTPGHAENMKLLGTLRRAWPKPEPSKKEDARVTH